MRQFNYVVGFLFSEDRSKIVLVQKNKPAWQAGRWNGVGGKLEPDERWEDCMSREFAEETGVSIPPEGWQHTVTLFNDGFECRFFRAFSDLAFDAKTVESETISLWDLDRLPECPVIDNLRWLVPIQLDMGLSFPLAPIADGLPTGSTSASPAPTPR